MALKVVVRIVLQYQPAIGLEHPSGQYEIGYLRDVGQRVRRPGKNVVVLTAIGGNKSEYIGPNDADEVGYTQLLRCFAHEIDAAGKFIYISHLGTASGDKLIAMAACTPKKVEHFDFLKVEVVVDDVEQALLGKVGSGAGGPVVGRRTKAPAFKFSANNTHTKNRLGAKVACATTAAPERNEEDKPPVSRPARASRPDRA